MKILMVCLGNICRSPLAEGILTKKIKQANLNWKVASAGTGSWHVGKPPHKGSQKVARKHGIDISKQCSRQFTKSDFWRYDLIFAMDSSNYQEITKLAPNEEARVKVKLILNESYPNKNRAVPDPYWENDGFEEVFQLLEQACAVIIKKYR